MENFVASDKPRICTNHFIDDWWEAKRKTPQPNIITDYPEQEKMSFSFSFFFFFFLDQKTLSVISLLFKRKTMTIKACLVSLAFSF